HAAVVPRADDPRRLAPARLRQRRGEALVNIPFAVRYGYDAGAGHLFGHGAGLAVAVQPVPTLLVLDGLVLAQVALGQVLPRPVLDVDDPQAQPFGGQGERGVAEQAGAVLVVERAEALDLVLLGGEVQLGGVLGEEDDGVLSDAAEGGVAVRLEDG